MNKYIEIKFASQLKCNLNLDPYVESLIERLQIIQAEAKDNILVAQMKSKSFFDQGKQTLNFDEGTKVWLLNRRRKIGENPKFYRKYIGPFIIDKNEGHNRYLLKDITTNKPFKFTVNGNSLKKYFDHDLSDNTTNYNTQTNTHQNNHKSIDKIIDKSKTKPFKFLVKYTDDSSEWMTQNEIPQTLIDDYYFKQRTIKTRSMTL